MNSGLEVGAEIIIGHNLGITQQVVEVGTMMKKMKEDKMKMDHLTDIYPSNKVQNKRLEYINHQCPCFISQ